MLLTTKLKIYNINLTDSDFFANLKNLVFCY